VATTNFQIFAVYTNTTIEGNWAIELSLCVMLLELIGESQWSVVHTAYDDITETTTQVSQKNHSLTAVLVPIFSQFCEIRSLFSKLDSFNPSIKYL